MQLTNIVDVDVLLTNKMVMIPPYLIPNNGYLSLYEIGETVFNKNIIFYFGLSDIYERNSVKLSALKDTELSHVIWSYIDNN